MRSLLSRMFSSRAVGAEGNSSFDLVDLCATFGSDPFLINFARLCCSAPAPGPERDATSHIPVAAGSFAEFCR